MSSEHNDGAPDDRTLGPIVGGGLLARYGELVVLYAAPAGDDQRTAAVLDALTSTASSEDGDGRRLGRQLAGLLLHDADFPALAAFGPAGNGVAVIVHGQAQVSVRTDDGNELVLDGRDAFTWVDRIIPTPAQVIRGALGTLGGQPLDPWARLDAGVVRAGGFVFGPPSAEAAAPAATAARVAPELASGPPESEPPELGPPQSFEDDDSAWGVPPPRSMPPAPPAMAGSGPWDAAPAASAWPGSLSGVPPLPDPASLQPSSAPPAGGLGRDAPFEAVLLIGGQEAQESQEGETSIAGRVPLAEGQPSENGLHADGAEDVAARPIVLGIFCKNEHFNDPRAPYCAVCGMSMAQLAHVSRTGPRPSLGTLVLDDGATFGLDTDYVVGREPERDEAVLDGRARALRIDDPKGVVSRIHARVELDGWDVTVVDLESANGTHIAAPNSESWTRLDPHRPVVLTPGTRVVFGRRGFRYESQRDT